MLIHHSHLGSVPVAVPEPAPVPAGEDAGGLASWFGPETLRYVAYGIGALFILSAFRKGRR